MCPSLSFLRKAKNNYYSDLKKKKHPPFANFFLSLIIPPHPTHKNVSAAGGIGLRRGLANGAGDRG
jgi:hypothetical protein